MCQPKFPEAQEPERLDHTQFPTSPESEEEPDFSPSGLEGRKRWKRKGCDVSTLDIDVAKGLWLFALMSQAGLR